MHLFGMALGDQMGAARRFLHLRTLPPSQQLWFPSISDSIGYEPSYWDYSSFLTLLIHELIHIFPLDWCHYRNSQLWNPKMWVCLIPPIFMLITPQISQVFTSIWLINNLITLPTSPNLPRIQKKHQNQASWLASPGGSINTARPFIKKPRIGFNNKRHLAVTFVPPGDFLSQPKNAVEMVWVAW